MWVGFEAGVDVYNLNGNHLRTFAPFPYGQRFVFRGEKVIIAGGGSGFGEVHANGCIAAVSRSTGEVYWRRDVPRNAVTGLSFVMK